jgi:hypothetical protein
VQQLSTITDHRSCSKSESKSVMVVVVVMVVVMVVVVRMVMSKRVSLGNSTLKRVICNVRGVAVDKLEVRWVTLSMR